MEIPIKAKNLPENLFLFNEKNRDFVSGKISHPYLGKQRKVYLFGVLFFTMIALPISVIVSLGIAVLYDMTFAQAMIAATVFAFAVTVILIGISYRLRHKLSSSKTILIGHVTGYEVTVAASRKGYTSGTRLRYSFTKPDGTTHAAMIVVSTNRETLIDGRDFPDIGIPIAVLYADEKTFTIL